jgi:hypothetical protein
MTADGRWNGTKWEKCPYCGEDFADDKCLTSALADLNHATAATADLNLAVEEVSRFRRGLEHLKHNRDCEKVYEATNPCETRDMFLSGDQMILMGTTEIANNLLAGKEWDGSEPVK